jgi:hypothetical protein
LTQATTRWHFGPVAASVEITCCTGLIGSITHCLHGWPVIPWMPESTDDPAIAITTRGTEFVLTSHFIIGEETYTDEPSIVCAFMAELIMAYGATQRDNLFLHAGGASGLNIAVHSARPATASGDTARAGPRIQPCPVTSR